MKLSDLGITVTEPALAALRAGIEMHAFLLLLTISGEGDNPDVIVGGGKIAYTLDFDGKLFRVYSKEIA